jgi:hypothetical protein
MAGGNHDGDIDWDQVMLPLASAAIRAANRPRDFPFLGRETRGSVQILRFRATSGMPTSLKPAKQVRKQGFEPFYSEIHRFTKAGFGQTWEKLRKEWRLLTAV